MEVWKPLGRPMKGERARLVSQAEQELWDRLAWHEGQLRRRTEDYRRARDHHRSKAIAIAAKLGVAPNLYDGPEAA